MRSLDRCPAPRISPFKRLTAIATLTIATLAGCTTESNTGGAEGPAGSSAAAVPQATGQAAMNLVFTANPQGHDQIFELPLALLAEPPAPLTDASCDSHNPQPRPHSRQVVYYSRCAGGPSQICTLDLDSHVQTQLTHDTDVQNYDPTYVPGPDNKLEIVWKRSDANGDYGELWVMDLDGSNRRNLTRGFIEDNKEAWKPAAAGSGWLIFTVRERQSDPNSDELYSLNLTNGARERLTTNTVPDWFPSYSPQQNKVVFVTKQDGHDVLATMNPDGKDVRVIVDMPGDNDDPSWNPDGSTVVFINNRGGRYSIYAYVVATGQRALLYDGNKDGNGRALSPLLVPVAG